MTRPSTARLIVALVLLVFTFALVPPPLAHGLGSTLYVTTLADSGAGSLRTALTTAIDNDTIRFSVSGTILLTSTLPHVTQNPLTIDGQGQTITIDGQNAYQLFSVDGNKVLHLRNLEVAHGSYGAGGAIYIEGNYSASGTTVDNVSFVGNSAPSGRGGVIWNGSGALSITNSTFYGNSAGSQGGALYNANGWMVDVVNSTFYSNSAPTGAVAYNNSGSIWFKSSILANSVTGSSCSGAIGDNGYNLEDATSCNFSVVNHSLSSTDPHLGPLAANGGPTRTMALLAGSPALDKIPVGTNGCGTTITTDQRGVPRPQGTLCDIGAFERILPLYLPLVLR